MENHEEKIRNSAVNRNLQTAFVEYSSRICLAPKKRIRTNGYNKFIPQGHMTAKNESYKKEIQVWKKTKLFPYFLELGFTKEEISSAWKNSIFNNGRTR